MKSSMYRVWQVIFNLILAFLALVTVIPFVWMFISSFSTNADIVAINSGFFPKPHTLENYKNIQQQFDFLRLFGNSLFISLVKTAITLYTSALLGFIFGKMRFRGRNILFGIVMATMMVPGAVTIIPQYEMIVKWGWLNSYKALILPGMISAFGIFLFKQAMSAIPDEMLEAARVDGAGDWRIFHQIVLPMTRNTAAALVIFTFLWNWEDYLWPFLIINDQDKQMLSVGLQLFNGRYGTDYGGLFAATSLAIIPVLIVYVFFQKQFIAGVASGAVK